MSDFNSEKKLSLKLFMKNLMRYAGLPSSIKKRDVFSFAAHQPFFIPQRDETE